ncbi:MAG: hypothetical protein QXU98_08910 [Candidatus Parvarchaeota archaeon]
MAGIQFLKILLGKLRLRTVGDAVMRIFDCEVHGGLILRIDISPNISQQFRKAMNILGIKLQYI